MAYILMAFAIALVLLIVWMVRRNLPDRKSYEDFLNRDAPSNEEEDEPTDRKR